MAEKRKYSVQPREKMKYICRMQLLKGMVLLFPRKIAMVLGTQAVVYHISSKERLQRKKYMGVRS